MNKIIRLLLIILLAAPLAASAGEHDHDGSRGKGKPRMERKEWMKKMQEYKHAYLAKELDLSEKQAEDFFKVYDARDKERFEVEERVRKITRQVRRKGAEATDEELDEAMKAQRELNRTLLEIDEKYDPSFRKLLTKRQLVRLPDVERDFYRSLMDHRRECPPPPEPKE